MRKLRKRDFENWSAKLFPHIERSPHTVAFSMMSMRAGAHSLIPLILDLIVVLEEAERMGLRPASLILDRLEQRIEDGESYESDCP